MDKVSRSVPLEEIQVVRLKSNQSINESNLMTLPFISMQRQKVSVLERIWETKNGNKGIKVVGGELGCPTILELDVLLALFRILIKNVGYEYEYNRTTGKVNLPKTIHFTFQELAKELGFVHYGGSYKARLENSIKCLIEATLYSNFALLNIKEGYVGDYLEELSGEQSFRILKNYKSYSYTRKKIKNEKIGNAQEVKDQQSVDIDDFFFENMCNNFFKIYDYSKYVRLKKGMSKKLYLLLCQWSTNYEKKIKYETLYDYLSIDVGDKQYYYNRLIRDTLKELQEVEFIQNFEILTSEGINIVFNQTKKAVVNGLNKYNDANEVIDRFQEIGFNLSEWTQYYRLDNEEYVKALLRYVDYKIAKGENIINLKNYVQTGLKTEGYEVDKFRN